MALFFLARFIFLSSSVSYDADVMVKKVPAIAAAGLDDPSPTANRMQEKHHEIHTEGNPVDDGAGDAGPGDHRAGPGR
jgi:hypothetical protein